MGMLRSLGKGVASAAGGISEQAGKTIDANLEMVRKRRLAELGIEMEGKQYDIAEQRKRKEMTDPESSFSLGREFAVEDEGKALKRANETAQATEYRKAVAKVMSSDMMDEDKDKAIRDLRAFYNPDRGSGDGAATGGDGAVETGDAILDTLRRNRLATSGGTPDPTKPGSAQPDATEKAQPKASLGDRVVDAFTPEGMSRNARALGDSLGLSGVSNYLSQALSGMSETGGESGAEDEGSSKTGRSRGRSAAAYKKDEPNRLKREEFNREMMGSENKTAAELMILKSKYEEYLDNVELAKIDVLIKRKQGQKVGSGRSAR